MKVFLKKMMLCMLLLSLFFCVVSAQSLEERLQSMAAKNAELYVTPLATAFGSGLNSGWFHSAKPHKLLGFDLGVKAMYITFPDDQKTFSFDVSDLVIEESIEIQGSSYDLEFAGSDIYAGDNEVPTFFGDDEAGSLETDENALVTSIESQLLEQGVTQQVLDLASTEIQNIAANIPALATPPGTGFDFVPLMVPQAALGLSIPMMPIKAEVVFRGAPERDIEDVGKFKFAGGGVKLAIDPFLPVPILDIAVGTYFQSMTIGDILESKHSLFNLQVGKSLNLKLAEFGVYGAFGLESSTLAINYTIDDPGSMLDGTEVDFDMEGENKTRITVGARARLTVFSLHVDYTMGVDNVMTAGLGLSLR